MKVNESSVPDCGLSGGHIHSVHRVYPGIEDLAVTPVNGPDGSTFNYKDNIQSYQCWEARHST
jgi:hypothetical protein